MLLYCIVSTVSVYISVISGEFGLQNTTPHLLNVAVNNI